MIAPHPAHGLVEHRLDLVERHRVLAVAASGGVVRNHGDGGVLEADLARERRLGHAGHADDVGAVALQAVDLRRRLEARALGRGVDAAVHDALADGARPPASSCSRTRARIGLGEIDVVDRLPGALEESGRAAPGVVDDLVRQHQRAGPDVVADAADRGHRDDASRRPPRLQRPEVGAVVHLVRRDGVAVAVAGEEDHVAARRCARRSARPKARRRACAPPCAASTSRLASCVRPLPPMIASIAIVSSRGSPAGCARSLSRPCRSRRRSGRECAGRRNPA